MVSSACINFQNYVRIISQGLITLWNVGAPTIRRASFQQHPNECSILSIILFSFYLVFHSLDSFFFFPRRESNPREKKHPIGTRCSSQGTSYSQNNGVRLSIPHRTTATTYIDSPGNGGLFARNIEFSVKVYRAFSSSQRRSWNRLTSR